MPVTRGAALLVAGAWLGLLVASWIAATASFGTVDRVLGPEIRPELSSRLAPLAADDRRVAFRHLASEINRWMFARLGLAQIALAVCLLITSWPWRGARGLAVAVIVVVLIQASLAPAIESLGRSIDFVPRPLPPEVGRRFGTLHGAFVLLDLAKAALLLGAAYLVVRLPLK